MKELNYIAHLKKRGLESRAYQRHQALGVEIAEILNDTKHTGLYIKLVKRFSADPLIQLARDIAQRPNVKNKGAYFMKIYPTIATPAIDPKKPTATSP